MVGSPEEDIDFIRRLSKKLENPPVSLSMDIDNKEFMLNNSSGSPSKVVNRIIVNKKEDTMDEVPSTPSNRKSKPLKVKKDDDVNEEEIIYKRSVLYDDDEDNSEEKKVNLKRTGVDGNYIMKREFIEFVPTANPSFKSRKTFASKVLVEPVKSILSKSKILAKNLAKSVPKPPNSLPLCIAVISNGLNELIEGDYFADDEANKTIVTYVLDVFKYPDG
jgi:hypothetical protein